MEAAVETFKAHFSELEDPRVNVHNQLHSLEDILNLICNTTPRMVTAHSPPHPTPWLRSILWVFRSPTTG